MSAAEVWVLESTGVYDECPEVEAVYATKDLCRAAMEEYGPVTEEKNGDLSGSPPGPPPYTGKYSWGRRFVLEGELP